MVLHKNLAGDHLHIPQDHTHLQIDITDLEDFLTEVDADLLYSQLGHDHVVSEITDFDPTDYLPLAGGTLSGDLNFSQGLVLRDDAAAILYVSGGETYITATGSLNLQSGTDIQIKKDTYLDGANAANFYVQDNWIVFDNVDSEIRAVPNAGGGPWPVFWLTAQDELRVGYADFGMMLVGTDIYLNCTGVVNVGNPNQAAKVIISTPASSGAALDTNGSISFYLDEVGNNLKAEVKYSDGTTKTGTIALT